MFKKVVLLTLVLTLLVATPIFAVDKITVTPERSTVFMCWGSEIGLHKDNFVCYSFHDLKDVYASSIEMKLQKYENGTWVTKKTWTSYLTGLGVDINRSYPASPGVWRTYAYHKAGGETKISYSPNFLY